MLTSEDIDDPQVSSEELARAGLKSRKFLKALVQAEASGDNLRCLNALLSISEEHPESLYPLWDELVQHLQHRNPYVRVQAVDHLANLACVDVENRFAGLVDGYFALLHDRTVTVAMHVARNAGKLVRSLPALEPAITAALLAFEQTEPPALRKEQVKHCILTAFDEYFDAAQDKPAIQSFVCRQLDSPNAQTRQEARRFVRRLSTRRPA